jgi:hypothetical protein
MTGAAIGGARTKRVIEWSAMLEQQLEKIPCVIFLDQGSRRAA